MNIPFVDLTRQYRSIKREIDDKIKSVLESGDFILGKNVAAFEEEFARYCGTKYGVGVASGTDALMLSLRALGIGSGDRVITVANTFISTVDAIAHNGAKPVFVDVDDAYTMDVEKIEPLINRSVKAIIPVHLFGHPVDMGPVLELAEKHNLFVVEDAAQAHGAEYKGRKVGSFGDCACFSFYPAKNLGAYGDGGIVVTDDPKIKEEINMLRHYGQKEKNRHDLIGYNSRLDELQATILRVKLKYIDKWNSMRRKNAKKYAEMLSGLQEVTLPIERGYAKHVFHLFVIRLKQRDEAQKWLASKGIGTGVHYPIPIHLQKSYKHLGVRRGSLSLTEMYSREILSLPMFPELSDAEIEYVCKSLEEFFEKAGSSVKK